MGPQLSWVSIQERVSIQEELIGVRTLVSVLYAGNWTRPAAKIFKDRSLRVPSKRNLRLHVSTYKVVHGFPCFHFFGSSVSYWTLHYEFPGGRHLPADWAESSVDCHRGRVRLSARGLIWAQLTSPAAISVDLLEVFREGYFIQLGVFWKSQGSLRPIEQNAVGRKKSYVVRPDALWNSVP